MKDKILKQLSEIRPEFDFTQSSNFIAEGLLDSFDVVQLVAALDAQYNISIDGMDIIPENFSSIESITAILIKNGAKDELNI
jgi:acyl carrier protein